MKLSECKIGVVVCVKTSGDIGHIVGLTRQFMNMNVEDRGDVLPLVHIAGEFQPQAIHQGKLEILKD